MKKLRRNQYENKDERKKERMIMLASAILVLVAMTATGIYVRQVASEESDDGYTVDFETLEQEESKEEIEKDNKSMSDSDMDYDPSSYEVQSDRVVNPLYEDSSPITKDGLGVETEASDTAQKENEQETDVTSKNVETKIEDEEEKEEEKVAQAIVLDQVEEANAQVQNSPTLSFGNQSSLIWPVVGDILIPYSMDKSVYFSTLGQYKYSPAVIISSAVDTGIYAPADALVKDIYYSSVNGNMIEMDLGNGYTLTLGQLADISISKGTYVFTGDPIGKVAAPTKYYSVEGSNLYLKMTKDGTAVNPMNWLG